MVNAKVVVSSNQFLEDIDLDKLNDEIITSPSYLVFLLHGKSNKKRTS